MISLSSLRKAAAAWIATGALALPASAQITTGTVSGTVKDPQGGVIPGATVTLVSESQGTRSTPAVTSERGDFVFPSITAGTYTIEVEMPSFKTLKRTGVAVSPGRDHSMAREYGWRSRTELREKDSPTAQWVDVAQQDEARRTCGCSAATAGGPMDQAIGFADGGRSAAPAGRRRRDYGLGRRQRDRHARRIESSRGRISLGGHEPRRNFRPPKVYDQIEMSIPYAVSTHVKTTVANDDGKTRSPFDFDRVFTMFARQGFKGYMGLEYEAPEDPAVAVPRYLRQLKELAVKYSA